MSFVFTPSADQQKVAEAVLTLKYALENAGCRSGFTILIGSHQDWSCLSIHTVHGVKVGFLP